jgi:hypothetical protein
MRYLLRSVTDALVSALILALTLKRLVPACRAIAAHSSVRKMLLKKMILLAAVVLAGATPALAARFATMPGCGEYPSDQSCTSIYINGEIVEGDDRAWRDLLKTIKTPHAVVNLNSPGGLVQGALLIAYDIIGKGYDTFFSDGRCNSACAFIWLSGKNRYMSSGVALGFHQPRSGLPGGGGHTTAHGTHMFDLYARLGVSQNAMKYFFSANPDEIAWVTAEKAEELGLKPTIWPKPKRSPFEPLTEKVAATSDQGGASVQEAPPTDCDTYAASGQDPDRKSASVPFNQIDEGAAVPACEAAVQQYPNSSRLSFQLNRAYQKVNNDGDAPTRYRKAADLGDASAQTKLGWMYQRGWVIQQDDDEALKWLRKAADQGDALGQYRLGTMYENGQGVPQDYAEAVKWYRLAADQGNALGRIGLDRLAATAANGLPQGQEIGAIKAKIHEAHMAQQAFGGMKYCSELNGTNFYFQSRDRIFNLEEYSRSLQNLVKTGSHNPATKHVWTLEDAQEREEEVKKQAQEDKSTCELVQSLPKLEKRLQELQSAAK